MAEAKISVRSDLLKIAEDLKIIKKTAQETADGLDDASKKVGAGVNDQTALVTAGMKKLRKLGLAVAKELKEDFKNLFPVAAFAGGLKIGEQLGGTVKEAMNLNDTIRRLGPILGMNEEAAEKFKRKLVAGLGEIGVGSEAAANALSGLSQTGVRGDKNLQEYAIRASQLASIGGQKGSEGDIAKGIADIIKEQKGDVNNLGNAKRVEDDVLRAKNATGKSVTAVLNDMTELFAHLNSDFQSRMKNGGAVTILAAEKYAGKGSTDFFKRYLAMDKNVRAGFDAQKLGDLLDKNGKFNVKAIQALVKDAKENRGRGNAEAGLITYGFSPEEAQSFVKLAEALKISGNEINGAKNALADMNGEFTRTMSLGDAFKANLNSVKGSFAGLMEAIGAPDLINNLTNVLSHTSKNKAESAVVVGGTALLGAVLAGKGLGGLKDLLGGEAKKAAIEKLTGEKVQRVEVINWPTSLAGAYSTFDPKTILDTAEKDLPAAAGMGGALEGGGAVLAGVTTAALASAAIGIGLLAGKVAKYVGEGGAEDDIKNIVKKKESPQDPSKVILPMDQYNPAFQNAQNQHLTVTFKSKDKSLTPTVSGSRGPAQ